MSGQNVGSKPLGPRDWLFGSRPRRLLLRRLLGSRVPAEGWTKTDLAKLAEVSPNGGVDEHVDGLLLVGLLARTGSRLTLPAPRPAMAKPLGQVTRLLDALPDEEIPRFPPAGTLAVEPVITAARELARARGAIERMAEIPSKRRAEALRALDEAARLVLSG